MGVLGVKHELVTVNNFNIQSLPKAAALPISGAKCHHLLGSL